MKGFFIIFLLSYSFSFGAIADSDIFASEEDLYQQEQLNNPDPFEKFNRKIYKFNNYVDKYTTKPVAKFYRTTIPKQARKSVNNFLSNLSLPANIINSAIQLDIHNTASGLTKFVINSTFGLFGIFDVASKYNVKVRDEDLGQTLAHYDFPRGPFIIVPFLGPSTATDFGAQITQWKIDPVMLTLDHQNDSDNSRYMLTAANIINTREKLLDITDDIEQNSMDPYTVTKSYYLQHREALIKNEK